MSPLNNALANVNFNVLLGVKCSAVKSFWIKSCFFNFASKSFAFWAVCVKYLRYVFLSLKYVTIWVATIAFIGAGFVGWGQFQFGRKSSTVAKIKDTEVSIQDVQEVYNNLFEEKNKQLGGALDDATAEKLGLKKQAFDMAIEQGILRQYAKDLGMYVTDEEVAKQILAYFKDKKTYIQYLTQTGQKAKDFEAKLKKQLLIQKLLTALHITPSVTLKLTFGSALYNSDNLEIKIINKSSIKVNLSEDEI